MAFTYTEDLTVARDYVRFHTGDTTESESFLSDAIIASLIADEGTNKKAVIAAIEYIIAKLSKPNFKADWLQVDNKTAREGYEKLLTTKKQKFGLLYQDMTHTPVYRMDEEETDTDALLTISDDELP
jgi:hypothetical protein